MLPTYYNLTNTSLTFQGSQAFVEYDLSLWLLQNMFAAFLLGVFMGLGAAMFYHAAEELIYEYVLPWIGEKVKRMSE
ncbi:MAG: hypothetical protein ACFFCD_17270 [Promethearchaeota archaeon]